MYRKRREGKGERRKKEYMGEASGERGDEEKRKGGGEGGKAWIGGLRG